LRARFGDWGLCTVASCSNQSGVVVVVAAEDDNDKAVVVAAFRFLDGWDSGVKKDEE